MLKYKCFYLFFLWEQYRKKKHLVYPTTMHTIKLLTSLNELQYGANSVTGY